MIDAMWKNLLPVVRNNPNLIALDLVNEWSFSDGVREIHPVMLAKFRAAMRERYGSVAAANRNWGTDCRDFDSLDPMKLKRVSTGFRYDFESFRNREGLENLRFLRDTARKYAPGTPLHVKSIAVTDLDPGQYLPVGVQREERGEITDFAGSDCAGIMELDFYRSMVPGKPAADTEFHVSVNTTPHEMAADAWRRSAGPRSTCGGSPPKWSRSSGGFPMRKSHCSTPRRRCTPCRSIRQGCAGRTRSCRTSICRSVS